MRKFTYTMFGMISISEQVVQAIEGCGMNRAALARESGISEGELSRVVAGTRSMTLKTLERLAPHIRVSIKVKRLSNKGRKGR